MSLAARPIALLVALVTLAACSGGGDAAPTTPPTPPPPTAVASVSVALGSPQLVVGGNTIATAETRSNTGASLTGRAVSWSSSNPTVASVSSTGAITALTPGTTSIVASSEGQTGSATLTVVGAPVAVVTVTLAQSSITIGATTTATATLRSATNELLTGRSITWTSSNTAVATVNASGTITALTPGTTTITATCEGQIGAITLTITPVPVASVSVSLAASNVIVGSTTLAIATVRSSTNEVLTGRTVSWTTSNPAVATVNASGSITTLTPGTVTITATSEGQSGSASLSVTQAPVATVAVALAQATIVVGAQTSATVTLRSAANQLLTGRPVAWSTSNPAVASVNAAGLVTALSSGSAVIAATSEGQSGAATLTVTGAPVANVVVAGPGTLSIGQTSSYSATLRDASGALLTDRSVSWLSSNTAVATVSTTGQVSAVAPGTTVISATSEGRVGTLMLTVRSSIAAVTITGGSRVKVGDQYSYTATARLSDGTVVPRTATWSVSNPSRGAMLSTGLLTPLEPGPITVQATIDGAVWEVTVDAYDWVRLVGTTSVFHYLPADNLITNKFGSSEYARLVFACSNTGDFVAFVMFDRFITASGSVAISFDGNAPFSQTWSEIGTFDALFRPGSNAVVKSFAQQVASARVFGFAFTEFQGSAKAMLFRVTGLGPRLTELFALCPSATVVQPVTAQAAAAALAEAQGVIAAFDATAGRVDALRETRQQEGASPTTAPTAELRRVQREASDAIAATKRR
jgi:uncharacterized protein YjdB